MQGVTLMNNVKYTGAVERGGGALHLPPKGPVTDIPVRVYQVS